MEFLETGVVSTQWCEWWSNLDHIHIFWGSPFGSILVSMIRLQLRKQISTVDSSKNIFQYTWILIE